jgi:nucleotide-binding universal stress UspA family protein
MPCLTELVRTLGPEEVVLLNVIESGSDREVHLTESYLRETTGLLKDSWKMSLPAMPNIRWSTTEATLADTAMLSRGGEAVASAILRFAEASHSDLIVMSTHGRTGFNRWLLGSVAEQVLQGAEVPIVLVRTSQERSTQPFQLRRVLVPLDGSPLGEQCLPYLDELAKQASPEITLLYVETAAISEPPDDSNDDELTYLDHIATGLKRSGLSVQTRVRRGMPNEEILDQAQKSSADLVVMTTHGRTGLGRLALGSVAHNVVSRSKIPVFLVRAKSNVAIMEHLKSPLVCRCYHCGHRTYLDSFSSTDRCGRCHYHLKACGNCVNFDGLACVLQLPYASETYPGNRCERFEFRKTRLVG